jgi:hypothetical protein
MQAADVLTSEYVPGWLRLPLPRHTHPVLCVHASCTAREVVIKVCTEFAVGGVTTHGHPGVQSLCLHLTSPLLLVMIAVGRPVTFILLQLSLHLKFLE